MNLISKFKETVNSVLPVMAIVIILGLTAAPLGLNLMLRFIIGGILLIIGLTIFLIGVDIGIQPLGEQTGAALTHKRNLLLLLSVSFIIGFFVTVAEPDIQVFRDQIHNVFNTVNKNHLVFIIAGGVGLLIVLGLMRTLISFNIKISLFILYLIVFALTFFTPISFRGIAFDSGGATTGPMTVPFILALGIGVSTVHHSNNKSDGADNFGLTGITSIGPIMAVLVYGIVLNKLGILQATDVASSAVSDEASLDIFIKILPNILKESAISIAPLFIMLIFFQLFLLRLPFQNLMKIIIGLIYSFIGLTIFLVGVNGGFMTAGNKLGLILGQKAATMGSFWFILLIATGLVIGAVVVCAEPAVWVLTEQVETLSGGSIKRKLLLIFLSGGASIAIGLAILRALIGFNLMYILIPGYALALGLMIWSPSLFTGIAFDSGGVASGPITSTFVLSFTLGASSAVGGTSDSFGVIALVAMMPLIAIQLLGIIYSQKQKKLLKTKMLINNKNGGAS